MQLNPDATFDCLFMADRLMSDAGTFTGPELHLFSYLACLLWLYRRRALSDWGYSFVGTELGAPFSLEIDTALRELRDRGYVVAVGDRLRIVETAEHEFKDFRGLALNSERVECLHAAYSSTSAYSVGIVGSALSQEPELRRSRAVPNNRPLLESAARGRLYEQFDALRGALNQEHIDLRVPAVVWLAALYASEQTI